MDKKIIYWLMLIVAIASCEDCPSGEQMLYNKFPPAYTLALSQVPGSINAVSQNGMNETFKVYQSGPNSYSSFMLDECVYANDPYKRATYSSSLYKYYFELSYRTDKERFLLNLDYRNNSSNSDESFEFETNLKNGVETGDLTYYSSNNSGRQRVTMLFHPSDTLNGRVFTNVFEIPLNITLVPNLTAVTHAWVQPELGLLAFKTSSNTIWYLQVP